MGLGGETQWGKSCGGKAHGGGAHGGRACRVVILDGDFRGRDFREILGRNFKGDFKGDFRVDYRGDFRGDFRDRILKRHFFKILSFKSF